MTGVVGRYGDDAWKVRVTGPPQDGAANTQLVRFVADLCGIRESSVRIVAGRSSRDKLVEIDGVELESVEAAFAGAAPC